jgi:DNA recombination protein RmuC
LTAQEGLKKEFENAGAKVLAQAQEAMLARAQERFTQSEEKNEARIKALLEPVGQRLASYEAQVGKLEKDRIDAFGQLGGLIQSMKEGQEQVRAEAARLGNSLTQCPQGARALGRAAAAQCARTVRPC